MFLTPDEVAFLTGYKSKTKQIEQLRRMHIAFFVNGAGAPVVAKSVIEGKKEEVIKTGWVSAAYGT